MRRIAKVDSNQPLIVKTFRQLGWIVEHTHQLGSGFPDIIVSKQLPSGHKFTAVVEIKDGEKPISSQKLTIDEAKWHSTWQGELVIINSVDAVMDYHNNIMREFG